MKTAKQKNACELIGAAGTARGLINPLYIGARIVEGLDTARTKGVLRAVLGAAILLLPTLGRGVVQVDSATRTVTTDLITVRWDLAHVDRIVWLGLNSSATNLTTYAGTDDYTGGAYIPDGDRFTSLNATNLAWTGQVLDGGARATVLTRSQLSGNAVMETLYEFRAGSAQVAFRRTLQFSAAPFTNSGKGLVFHIWYIQGSYLPFTYSKGYGVPGSGTSTDYPSAITDWDGRWADMVQVAYFNLPSTEPLWLYGDTDGLFGSPLGPGSRVAPAFSRQATLNKDLTVWGALYIHPPGATVAQIEQEYRSFLSTSGSLVNEDFDSYADGACPSNFYQFQYNYEYYPGSHIVSGVSPACPSSPKCFLATNPYGGWGDDITAPFSWNSAQYGTLKYAAKFMLPLNSSLDDNLELSLVVSPTDRRRICSMQVLETGSNTLNLVYGADNTTLVTGLQNNTWISLSGQLDAGTSSYDVYLNGVRVGSGLPLRPGMSVSQVGALFLGKGFWTASPGYIDDVSVVAVPWNQQVLVNENFDSYADGAWPSNFYQFQYNYEYYAGSHVVSGVSPACPSSPKCFLATNPYGGWGDDITVPFSWSSTQYCNLKFSAKFMLPLNSSLDDNLELSLVVSPTDRRRICSMQILETGSNTISLVYGADNTSLVTGLQDSTWISLCGELNALTSTYDIYLNGVQVGSGLPIRSGMSVSQVGALFLGKGFWSANPGYIDDVSVVALSSPAPNPPQILANLSGTNFTLSWPLDHIGWRLLAQTNNLDLGISSQSNDWGTVAGSQATNSVVMPIAPAMRTGFYRLVYP